MFLRYLNMEKIIRKCKFCDSIDLIDDEISKVYGIKIGSVDDNCDRCFKIFEYKQYIEQLINNDIEVERKLNEFYDGHNDCVFNLPSRVNFRYTVENRPDFINEVYNEILYITENIYPFLSGYIEILDSMYINKNKLWEISGTFEYFVNISSFQYIVIILNELLSKSNNAKFSINKIINILRYNKKALERQHIIEINEYSNEKNIELEYPKIDVLNFIEKTEDLLRFYDEDIKLIKDYRDNKFAHIGKLKKITNNDDYVLTSDKIKRLFSIVRIILDGIVCIFIPDKHVSMYVQTGIDLDTINKKLNR